MAPWKQLFRSSTDGHDLGQQPSLDKPIVTVSSGYHQGHGRRRISSESNPKTTPTTRTWGMRSNSMAESRPSTAPTLAQPKNTTTPSVPPSGTVGRITKRIFRPDVDKPSIKTIMRPISADSMQTRNRKPSTPLITVHLGSSKDPGMPQVSQLRFLEPRQEDEQQQESPTDQQDYSAAQVPRSEAILLEDAIRQGSLRAALAIDPTPSIPPRSSDSRQGRQPRRPVPKPASPPPSPYPSVSAPPRMLSPEVASQPAIDANPVVLQSKWSADSTPKILLRPLSNASSFERQDSRLLQRQVQAASMRRVQSAQLPVATGHLEVSGREPTTQPCVTPRKQAVSSVPSPPVLVLPAPARSPHHSTVTTKGHSPVMSPAIPLRTASPAVASSSAMDIEGGCNRDSFVSLEEEVLDYGSLGLPTERADSSEPTSPPPAPVPTKAQLATVQPVCAAHLDDSLVSGSGRTSDTIVSFATIRKWREQVAVVEPNVRMTAREVPGVAGEAGPSFLSPEHNNPVQHATTKDPARLDQGIAVSSCAPWTDAA